MWRGELLSVWKRQRVHFELDCGFWIWIKGSLVHGRIGSDDGWCKGILHLHLHFCTLKEEHLVYLFGVYLEMDE